MGGQRGISSAGFESPEPNRRPANGHYLLHSRVHVHHVHADHARAFPVVAAASSWVCYLRKVGHRTDIVPPHNRLNRKMGYAEIFRAERLSEVYTILPGADPGRFCPGSYLDHNRSDLPYPYIRLLDRIAEEEIRPEYGLS